MNYPLLTPDQIESRFLLLSSKLQEAALSENISAFLARLTDENKLNEEDNLSLQRLVGLIILGFMPAEALGQELRTSLGLDEKITDSIAGKINQEILKSLEVDLKALYQKLKETEEEGSADAEPPSPLTEVAAMPMPLEQKTPEAPRLIREEEKLQPIIGEKYYSPLKPSFYKPEEAGTPENQPPAVKLEFNLGQTKEKLTETPKVVNYSELKTPLPADAPLIAREVPPEPQPPKVQPENIINLKDLPK